MKEFDLCNVIKGRLSEASLGKVFTKLPSAKTNPDAVVVSLGLTSTEETYFDGEQDIVQSVSVFVRRRNEDDASNVADEVGHIIRTSDLSSENGSYTFTSATTSPARPFAWDPSGFFVWELSAQISITRKD